MDKKSRDIFYGTVLVATLIIALVGTTMAYFSYRTGGSDESIKAHSANLNIVYSDGAVPPFGIITHQNTTPCIRVTFLNGCELRQDTLKLNPALPCKSLSENQQHLTCYRKWKLRHCSVKL